MDSTKLSGGDKSANSISTIVSTYDRHMVNYYTKSVVQPKKYQGIVKLNEIMIEMLENFKKTNDFYPDYILIYRTGISDSQFNDVIDKEINLIKKSFSEISLTYSPKITFIVVQRRHHTR